MSGHLSTPGSRYRIENVDWSHPLGYIRAMYDVPAEIGGRVTVNGKSGEILGAAGHYLCVRLDGADKPVACHPTWRVVYA